MSFYVIPVLRNLVQNKFLVAVDWFDYMLTSRHATADWSTVLLNVCKNCGKITTTYIRSMFFFLRKSFDRNAINREDC